MTPARGRRVVLAVRLQLLLLLVIPLLATLMARGFGMRAAEPSVLHGPAMHVHRRLAQRLGAGRMRMAGQREVSAEALNSMATQASPIISLTPGPIMCTPSTWSLRASGGS